MMNLQDAVYNWLSIKQVYEARPEDNAAKETYDFFDEILKEDHGITEIVVHKDEMMYTIQCIRDKEQKKFQYPTELIDSLLQSIETEPKYNE